jgi:hypothetical protein
MSFARSTVQPPHPASAARLTCAFRPGYSADFALASTPGGWGPLLRHLFADLAHLPAVHVEQVRRKFGTLTVHIEAVDGVDLTAPAVDAQLDRARQLTGCAARASASTCEQCGAAAALRADGPVTALCDEHAAGRRALPTRA